MKKYFIFSLLSILVGCAQTDKPALVGTDRDEHGCIGSAGYTYSAVKNGCVRLWEEGIALFPQHLAANQALMAAYAIVGNNTAEVFLPEQQNPLHLVLQSSSEEPQWVTTDGSGWKLTADSSDRWTLLQNEVPLYTNEKPVH